MKNTKVTSALVAAGILASSVAMAAGWNPSEWLQKPAAVLAAAPAASNATPIAPTTAPNYRAIVQRYGWVKEVNEIDTPVDKFNWEPLYDPVLTDAYRSWLEQQRLT